MANNITVQPGQTLYGLYGPNWKQQSQYTGDPTKLPVGTVLPAPQNFSSPQGPVSSPMPNFSSRQGPTYVPPPNFSSPKGPVYMPPAQQMASTAPTQPSYTQSAFSSKPVASQNQGFTPSVYTPPQTHSNNSKSFIDQQVDDLKNTVVPQAYAADGAVSSPGYAAGTPDWVKPLVEKAASKYNIPTAILSALLKQESGFNANAESPVGALGIAQFMPSTAQGMGVNPLDPKSAIEGAARYLRQSWDKFGKIELALAAYNAGSGAVSQYGGIPPYAETQNYVKNIMAMAGEPHQSANGPYIETMNQLRKQAEKPTKLAIKSAQPTPILPIPLDEALWNVKKKGMKR